MGGIKRRVLVVDDARSIRDILALIISEMGYDVAVARDGNEGLDLFQKMAYDLVLTDVRMPGMDGWSLAYRIKDVSPRTPVVLVTGEEREAVLKKLKASSADSALFKPFRVEEVEETIQGVMGPRH